MPLPRLWLATAACCLLAVEPARSAMTLTVTSPAFAEGAAIPGRYTCDGENLAPPLAWSGVPEQARSLALIADDPDAPAKVWVHWVAYNLPPETRSLPEGGPLPAGAVAGRNDFGRQGYGGPCPPGGTHRYDFTLYALDTPLALPEGATKDELLAAMDGHVLASGRLEGRYARSR